MKSYKSGASLKAEAREFLTGKYSAFVIISMSFLCFGILLNYFFSLIYSAFISIFSGQNGNTVFPELIRFFLSVCSVALVTNLLPGFCLFCLKFINRSNPNIADLFHAYRNQFQKNITVSALLTVPRLLFLEPFVINYDLFNTTLNLNYLFPAIPCRSTCST